MPRDSRDQPCPRAPDGAIRAWRKSHPAEAHVLDMLLEGAGRDRFGAVIGTLEDLDLAKALAHVAVGVCPACAYPLDREVEQEDDGCVVCPECGSAWRLPDEIDPTHVEGRRLILGIDYFRPAVQFMYQLWDEERQRRGDSRPPERP